MTDNLCKLLYKTNNLNYRFTEVDSRNEDHF